MNCRKSRKLQAGLNIQSSDHSGRFIPESALIPATCQTLTGGSSNPPKFGTLIPNRIFVGGIPSNSETLVFKDRKLNIGHAIRKQVFPRTDVPATLFFAGGAMPYGFQNGMTVFSLPGQEYPMLAPSHTFSGHSSPTQATTPYATMMLPQPGAGTTLYLPSTFNSASPTAGTSPYAAQLSQQQVTAAMHQQYSSPSAAAAAAAVVANQLTQGGGCVGSTGSPVANTSNNHHQNNTNTAAMMAAAAAAMAAAVQWPQSQTSGLPQQQLASVTSGGHTIASQGLTTSGGLHAVTHNAATAAATLTPQQAAALAATVAAQNSTGWRWSPNINQTQPQLMTTMTTSSPSSSSHLNMAGSTNSSCVSLSSSATANVNTSSTPTLHSHQQSSPTATLGPAAYLYSPLTGTGHELMFFHQTTSSPYAANSTSDYSTDHSTQSSALLESIEPFSFPCDATPLGRHSQLSGQMNSAFAGQSLDPSACISPYAAFAPLLDIQTQGNGAGVVAQTAASGAATLLQQHHHQQQQQHNFRQSAAAAASLLAASQQQPPPSTHLVQIANVPSTLVAHQQQQQQAKVFSPTVVASAAASGGVSSGGGIVNANGQLSAHMYSHQGVNVTSLSEVISAGDMTVASSLCSPANMSGHNNVSSGPASAIVSVGVPNGGGASLGLTTGPMPGSAATGSTVVVQAGSSAISSSGTTTSTTSSTGLHSDESMVGCAKTSGGQHH